VIIPDNIDFEKYLSDISFLEASDLKWAGGWKDELRDRERNGVQIVGEKLPWTKTHDYFRLRPGELTIWAGYNGHRKSMLVGQVMLWLCRDNPVCIASFEMTPLESLFRMCQQAAGCYHP